MRPRILALLALLLTLGLGVALFVGGHAPPERSPGSESVPDAAAPTPGPAVATLRGAPLPTPHPPAAENPPPGLSDAEASGASGRVEVLVVDEEGRGIAGAEVRLHHPFADASPLPASTDAAGRAAGTQAPVGEVHASATALGYEGASSWGDVRDGETLALRVMLRPEVLLRVRVVADVDGSPIEGASVQLVHEGSIRGRTVLASHDSPIVDAGVTSAEGLLTFTVSRGRIATVRATASGYGTVGQAIERKGAGPEVELRLPPGVRVHGRLHTPEGAACPDATVWIVLAGVPQLLKDPRMIVGPEGSSLTADPGVDSSSTVEVEGPIYKARVLRADRDGVYGAEGFTAGSTIRVLAEAPDGARGLSPPTALPTGVRDVLLDLTLEPRSTLVVHASPMRGYESESIPVELQRLGTTFSATTGDGRRSVFASASFPARFTGLAARTYRLIARLPGAVPIARDVAMPREGVVELTLEGEVGRTLEGIVVDAMGQPIPNAQIQWWTEGGAVDGYGGRRTNDEGRFVLQGIAPEATWTVRAEAETHVGRNVEGGRSEAQELRIELSARPLLHGRLVLAAGMTARPYVWVGEKTEDGETYRTAAVDVEGTLRYALQSDDAECVVVLLPWEGADVLLGTFLLGPGESRELGAIHITAGRTVRGRVLTTGGEPLADASVRVEQPGARGLRDGMFVPRREAVTAADGAFAVATIHEGPAVVVVERQGYAATEALENGSGDPITIRLKKTR